MVFSFLISPFGYNNDRRTKKKDKDCGSPTLKPAYLDENMLKETIDEHIPAELSSLQSLVELPYGFSQDEWLAWHTISFFHQLDAIISVMTCPVKEGGQPLCSQTTCPSMTGPGDSTYSWQDEKGRKQKCSAPQYFDFVSLYIQKAITDETIFPTRHGEQFPPNFHQIVEKLFKYMFHNLAHLFSHHYLQFFAMQLTGHVNTLYKHFMLFATQYQLLEHKESDVLTDLTQALQTLNINKENSEPEHSGSSNHSPEH